MNSSDRDRRFDWHPVDRHAMVLRGNAGASVTLTAKGVLCEEGRVHDPSAIGFEIEISLPGRDEAVEALRLAMVGGFYGDLDHVRRDFTAMRATAEGQAEIIMEGLALRVSVCHHAARTVTVVEGTFSTLPAGVPFREIETRLLGRSGWSTEFQLRFACLTSLIDPPYVDQFIGQIDALRAHLRLFAPD